MLLWYLLDIWRARPCATEQ